MLKMSRIILPVFLGAFLGCGQKDEQKAAGEKSKVEEAVKEAVTKEFKMYEGAKAAVDKIQKEAQEKREKEAK
jgi:hypothetical protein